MEDVDPSVGKFRNVVSTTIIPNYYNVVILVSHTEGDVCFSMEV